MPMYFVQNRLQKQEFDSHATLYRWTTVQPNSTRYIGKLASACAEPRAFGPDAAGLLKPTLYNIVIQYSLVEILTASVGGHVTRQTEKIYKTVYTDRAPYYLWPHLLKVINCGTSFLSHTSYWTDPWRFWETTRIYFVVYETFMFSLLIDLFPPYVTLVNFCFQATDEFSHRNAIFVFRRH